MKDHHRVWITAKNGFLGRSLSELLLSSNHQTVRATDRKEVQLLDENSVRQFLNDFQPNIIIHTAVVGGRRTTEETEKIVVDNLRMFEVLTAATTELLDEPTIIHFDSGASFDRRRNIDSARESDIGRHIPADFYGFSKFVITQRCRGMTNTYNLRIFNCFGPHETTDRMITGNILKLLREEDIIVHHPNKQMDFFFVEDLHQLVECAIRKDNSLPKEINLVYPGEKKTLFEVAEMLLSVGREFGYGKNSKIKTPSFQQEKAFINANNYTGSAEVFQTVNLQKPLIGLREGVRKMFAYHIANMSMENGR